MTSSRSKTYLCSVFNSTGAGTNQLRWVGTHNLRHEQEHDTCTAHNVERPNARVMELKTAHGLKVEHKT